MKLPVLLNAPALLFVCAACSGNPAPVEVIDPIPLPDIPAKYVSDTLVVPDELRDEFNALVATPYPDYWHIDPKTFKDEKRRAAVYWRFSRKAAIGNGFWLDLNAVDRKATEIFVKRLAAGWSMRIVDSYYTAADHVAHYELFRTDEPFFSLGETAWLCEWLLLNYPEYFVDCIANYNYTHSEGSGDSI